MVMKIVFWINICVGDDFFLIVLLDSVYSFGRLVIKF